MYIELPSHKIRNQHHLMLQCVQGLRVNERLPSLAPGQRPSLPSSSLGHYKVSVSVITLSRSCRRCVNSCSLLNKTSCSRLARLSSSSFFGELNTYLMRLNSPELTKYIRITLVYFFTCLFGSFQLGILRNESSWMGTRIQGLGNCPQTHEPHQCTLASTGECLRLPIFSAGKGEGQQQQWMLGVLSQRST